MAAITSIWINENEANRVCVGFANGDVQATADAGSLALATWAKLVTLPAGVEDLAESPDQFGQYWVCSGRFLYVTFDSFGTYGALSSFPLGSTARKIANSPFGNFVSGTVPAASGYSPVRWADGDVELTMPVLAPAVEDVRALMHHLYEDKLYGIDVLGRVLYKAPGDLSMSHILTLSDYVAAHGEVRRGIRDSANQNVYYVIAENALMKTFDSFLSAVKVRGYTAPVSGRQLGLGQLGRILITGRRVWVGANLGTAPKVCRCDNVYAALPAWVNMSTGLPGSGTVDQLILDPSSVNRGYCRVGSSVYRCDDMRGGGSWTKVADLTTLTDQADALWGTHDDAYCGLHSIGVDMNGVLVLLITIGVTGGTANHSSLYLLHSHDQGGTYTRSNSIGHQVSTAYGPHALLVPNALGQGKAWVLEAYYYGGWYNLYSTVDYVSVTLGTFQSDGIYQYRSALGWDIGLPAGNALWLVRDGIGRTEDTYYTTDGFAADIRAWAAPGYLPVQAPDDPDLCYVWGLSSKEAKLSTDRGATSSVTHTFPQEIYAVATLSRTVWFALQNHVGACALWSCSVATLDSWTDRTGDLGTLVDASYLSLAVDPEV